MLLQTEVRLNVTSLVKWNIFLDELLQLGLLAAGSVSFVVLKRSTSQNNQEAAAMSISSSPKTRSMFVILSRWLIMGRYLHSP